MSFIGDLFGGGDEGTPSQAVDVTPDEFEKLRGPVSNVLRGILAGKQPNLAGVPAYSGPTAAPVTAQEQGFLDKIGATAVPSASATASRDLVNRTLGGQFLSPQSNPFLKATIDAATRPVRQAFDEVVAPELRSRFTAAGQIIQGEGSSPFAQAFARAGRDLLNTIADTSARISADNFARERAAQQQAVGQAIQIDSEQLDRMVKGLQASALPRLIDQFGIDRGIDIFNQRVSTLLDALRLATAASSPTVVMLPGSPGPDHGGLLAGLGSLAFGVGSLFNSPTK